jgi:hypothetical protein
MIMGDNKKIDNNKRYMSNAGDFDTCADAAVRCGASCPMEQDVANGQVLALHCRGSCHGRRFRSKTQNTNKKLFSATVDSGA